MAAVALDGGQAYMQRRLVQNAADAAVLAAARDLALGGDEFSCRAVAREYAVARNAADALEDGDIDCGISTANQVVVTTTKKFPTWFGGVVGISEMEVGARAVAGIYKGEGCQTAPVALFDKKVEEARGGPGPEDDQCIAIMDTIKEVGDVEAGYLEVAGANRGWLGLDCNPPNHCSPDADSLKEWMRTGYPDFVEFPDRYMGDPGSVTSAVAEAREQLYVIPVYNRVWIYTTQKRCQESWPSNDICMIGASYEGDDDYCEDDPAVPDPPDEYPPDYPKRCKEDCCCTPGAADVQPDGSIGPNNRCYEDDPVPITEYTTDLGLNGKYYYNIVDLVCFKVEEVILNAPVKEIRGCLSDECVASCLAGEPWSAGDDGPLVVRLID
jgi:hypothetical protein